MESTTNQQQGLFSSDPLATSKMVKEKGPHQRHYDVDGFKKRAACVCVKNENENEVLLISSSRNDSYWIVPGGGIEDNENPEEAAAREVYEEAGVQGRLGRFLGVFESVNRKHRTSVYIFIVDKEFEEWEEHTVLGRKRKWFDLTEAKHELEKHKPTQGEYLSLLKGYETSTINKAITNYGNNSHLNNKTYNNNSSNSNTDNSNDFNASSIHYTGSLLISAALSVANAGGQNLMLNSSVYSYNLPHGSSLLDTDMLPSSTSLTH